MSGFNDHFSGHASKYSAYRPLWPASLFAYLAKRAPACELAWDCATGNGQAARVLRKHFERVFASDASPQQIAQAIPRNRVDYRVEAAENCSLKSECVDLVFVAQAFHWFDRAAFLAQAKRVLKPAGLIAIGSYQLATVTTAVDAVVRHLWGEILNGYWPPERALVDRGLDGVTLPYIPVHTPDFEITEQWDMHDLLNYLDTWSAVQRFRRSENLDPLDQIIFDLEQAWEIPKQKRKISWPIILQLRRKPS